MAQIDYSERFWEVEYTYLSADDWFREGATHDSLAAATDAMEGMRVRRLNIATFEYRVVEVNITRTVVGRADEVATWVPSKAERGIVDEKCKCGHLKSQHEAYVTAGQGSCKACVCEQFTWTGWAYATELIP